MSGCWKEWDKHFAPGCAAHLGKGTLAPFRRGKKQNQKKKHKRKGGGVIIFYNRMQRISKHRKGGSKAQQAWSFSFNHPHPQPYQSHGPTMPSPDFMAPIALLCTLLSGQDPFCLKIRAANSTFPLKDHCLHHFLVTWSTVCYCAPYHWGYFF